jgi:cell division protein FtsL
MKFKFRSAVFILAIFVLLSVIHLFINTQNIDLKYKVTDLKIKLSDLKNKNRALGIQVAEKENLALIEKYAREKLKMIYPEEINYVKSPGHSSQEARP